MKVLFFLFFPRPPHFGTELELIKKHVEQNDDVYVVRCKGDLAMCQLNPEHKKDICLFCQSMYGKGMQMINNKNIHQIFLPHNQSSYTHHYAVQSVEELINLRIEGVNLGRQAAFELITLLDKDHDFDTVKYSGLIDKQLNTVHYLYTFADSLFHKLRPNKVYIYHGRNAEAGALVLACKKLRIDFSVYEDANRLENYWLLNNAVPHDYKYIHAEIEETWKRGAADKYVMAEEYFRKKRDSGDFSGVWWAEKQRKGEVPASLNDTNINIVFFGSTMQEHITNPERSKLIYKNELVALERIVRTFQGMPKYKFYYRTHPNLAGCHNTQTRTVERIAKDYSNLEVIPADSPVSSYELLEKCHTVVIASSTLGVEACYWRKPVVLLGRSFYEQLECCYFPKTHSECITLLTRRLKPKNILGALKFGYWANVMGTPFSRYRRETRFNGLFPGYDMYLNKESILASSIRSVYSSIKKHTSVLFT